jgi:hypothetical protein
VRFIPSRVAAPPGSAEHRVCIITYALSLTADDFHHNDTRVSCRIKKIRHPRRVPDASRTAGLSRPSLPFTSGLRHRELVPKPRYHPCTTHESAAQSGDAPAKIRGHRRAYLSGAIRPHLAVQPDLQFVMNPNTDPRIKNAVAFILRFEVSF